MSDPRLRSVSRLGTAVAVLLGAQIVLDFITIAVLASRISLVDRFLAGEAIGQAEAEAADSGVAAVGGLAGVVFLATAVVWLIWQHHGQDNLVRRGVQGLRFTPGWAVGWWFVPFANLVKSFQSMRELRLASADPDGWQSAKPPALMVWWWVLWIVSAITVRVWISPVTAQDVKNADVLSIVSTVASIAAAILAIMVVRSITGLQERLRLTPPPAPAPPGQGMPLPPPP